MSDTHKNCLFCGKPLDGSKEHVLQECLGAKWESRAILCKACNKLFGDTLDNALAEAFRNFRSYLGILGKRDNIPDSAIVKNEKGEEFKKIGKTGEFIKLAKPGFQKTALPDGSILVEIEGGIRQAQKISEDLKKSYASEGCAVSDPKISSYKAESAGRLLFKFRLSLPVYLAIFKSLLNFCRMSLSEAEMSHILYVAARLRDFAEFSKSSPDDETLVSKALELNLPNFPLAARLSDKALKIIKGERNLYDALLLIPKKDGLYGAACLFSSLWWAFKLSDQAVFDSKPRAVVFDVDKGETIHDFENFDSLEDSDFEFQKQENSKLYEKFKKDFEQAAALCVKREFKQTVIEAFKPGMLADFFPITTIKDIKNILVERARIFLSLVMLPHGIPVNFFQSQDGIKYAFSPVEMILEHYGPNMRLDKDNFKEIINNLYGMCEKISHDKNILKCLKIDVQYWEHEICLKLKKQI